MNVLDALWYTSFTKICFPSKQGDVLFTLAHKQSKKESWATTAHKRSWLQNFPHGSITVFHWWLTAKSWFPSDRKIIVESCDGNWFGHTAKRFLIIYNSNLSYNKTQTVSVVLLSHIITNLIAITINVLELHDSTIALRSNGNQA